MNSIKTRISILIVLSTVAIAVSQINLSGTIVDENMDPIEGADVTLVNADISGATGENGEFTLSGTGIACRAGTVRDDATVYLHRRVLVADIAGARTQVSITAFDCRGAVAGRPLRETRNRGKVSYDCDAIIGSGAAQGMYVLDVRIGASAFRFPIAVAGKRYSGRGHAVSRPPAASAQANRATAGDVLSVSKDGYEALEIILDDLDTELEALVMPDNTAYPRIILNHSGAVVTMYKPDAEKGYYRSTRFDWSGMIARVVYKGHTFFREWLTPHDPEYTECGIGNAEEFDSGFLTPAQAFTEAEVGGEFIKIGVGVLKKTDGSYFFNKDYEIVEPGEWTIRRGPAWVEFLHTTKEVLGYQFEYTKRCAMESDNSCVTVTHTLKNTGTETATISHYSHNFTHIDDEAVGNGYTITFGFTPVLSSSAGGGWGNTATLQNGVLTYKTDSFGNLFDIFDGLTGSADDNNTVIENTNTNASVTYQGDWAPEEFVFWSQDANGNFDTYNATAPEPMLLFELDAGATKEWVSNITVDAE